MVIIVLVFGFLLFIAAVLASVLWKEHRRGIESPVRDLMLRAPGHSLNKRVIEFERNTEIYFFGCFGAPFVVGFMPLMVANYFGVAPWLLLTVFGLSIVLTCVGYVIGFRLARNYFGRSADFELGYRGELLVAEFLRPLERDGYHVFHDFPLQQQHKQANIDHIVVGRTGVWVIETKMRRKHRKVQSTRENFKVEFTGNELIYPTFRDRHGIDQTQANVRHLQDFLRNETGKSFPVSGILVLPGWYVHQSGNGPVQVTGHKTVANRIARGRFNLDDDLQRQAARAIEKVCRDVKV